MKEELIKLLDKAYAPYSNFHVACIVEMKDGKYIPGVNVENASYGATNCAERTAFFKAVSEGVKEFEAIAVVGRPADIIMGNEACSKENHITFSDYAYPCGICRQIMQEFCDNDFKIIVAKSTEDYKVYTLKELLPFGFGGSMK